MNQRLYLNQELALSFQDRNASKLYIYCDDGGLCLAIDNYDINSVYHITKKSELYLPMKEMFQKIKKADRLRNLSASRFGSKFEWVSEGYGIPEGQNRLIISEVGDIFTLNFIKSKYNLVDDKNICSIHFSLTESKNKPINMAFTEMFMDVYNNTPTYKVRKLTRNSLLK